MDYSNFSLESTFEANYLNISIPSDSRLDEIAVNVINDDCPDFLIPFKLISVNGINNLRYKLINTIALEYSNLKMSKKDFVHLFMELLKPMVNGKDYFLDYHCLCFDARYVYLESKTGKALFIYIPEQSYRSDDSDISAFLTDVFRKSDITDDADFQVRLYKLFTDGNVTISSLYQFFNDEERKAGLYQPTSTVQFQSAYSTQASSVNNYNLQNNVQIQPAPTPVPVQPVVSVQNPVPTPNSVVSVNTTPVSKPTSSQQEQGSTSRGLFHSKEKNQPMVETPNVTEQNPVQANGTDAMMALFDSKKKKDNKKNKEKPIPQKETQNPKPASEKKGGFSFGFPFGNKNQSAGNASVPVTNQIQQPLPMSQPQIQPIVQQQPVQQQIPAPSVYAGGYQMPSAYESDATEIFEEDGISGGSYMELIDSQIPGAPPSISLSFEKPFIEIGRLSSDQNRPDIAFGKEFSRIGRRHARIEKNAGGYSVIDLGSQNHTLLNQTRLVPNTAYPLKDGDILSLTESKPVRYRVHIY